MPNVLPYSSTLAASNADRPRNRKKRNQSKSLKFTLSCLPRQLETTHTPTLLSRLLSCVLGGHPRFNALVERYVGHVGLEVEVRMSKATVGAEAHVGLAWTILAHGIAFLSSGETSRNGTT